jgi:hypothetical protein
VNFDIPEGDEVYVYGSSPGGQVAGPYREKGPFKDGEFWADTVEGDTAIIEHYIRDQEQAFRIPEISHLFRTVQSDVTLNALPCQNDASCFPSIENNTVGRIRFMAGGDTLFCTGTILVDRNHYFPSLFLTANHCISSEEVARTVEVHWFYQSAACNSGSLRADRGLPVTGATLVATNRSMDTTLIRLLRPVPRNLAYSGWDAAIKPVGTNVFGLHHPDGFIPPFIDSRLRRSSGQITSLSGTCGPLPLAAGYRIDWSSGLTEGGSSGSGIWVTQNNQNFLVGVLSCGPAPICGGTNFDNYGKFSDFFPAVQSFISGQPCLTTPIAVGQTVPGQLASSDCQARRGVARRYTFNGLAGQQVQLSLESVAFDSYLSLLGPASELIDEDDDGGGGLNSRIPATGTLTLPANGTYTIEVSSFLGTSVGGFTLRLNGSQINQPVELGVDDGVFETGIGLTDGGNDHAVNRLTPANYPATLTDVTVFFRNSANEGVRIGDSITILSGANPSGSASIDNIALQRSQATVRALGQFVVYDVPDITIFSGDFVIGFAMTHSAGVFPIAVDQSPPLRRRSYVSSNGVNFFIIDDVAATLAGNFGIRGRVTQGSTPCTYAVSPSSHSFGSIGGNGSVSITTASNCSWTATSNSNWIVITSAINGSGSGAVFFSVLGNTGGQRAGVISIGGQSVSITQAAGGPAVTNADVAGKKLFVFGREFATGAQVLIDGIAQPKVKNDVDSPTTLLIAKKAGRNIARGQTVVIQVRNPNGAISQPFPWTRP